MDIQTVSGRWARLAGLSFITGFSGAMMPGPLMLAIIQQTLVFGWSAFVWITLGHALLEGIFVALLALGMRTVLARPAVRITIGLIGGAALIYMAADMALNVSGLTLEMSAEAAEPYSRTALMGLGAAISVANPYFTGWWGTIGVGQIAQLRPRTRWEYLVFYGSHEASDFLWHGVLGTIAWGGRGWLTDGMYQGLILFCALALGLIGLWFVKTGLQMALVPCAAESE